MYSHQDLSSRLLPKSILQSAIDKRKPQTQKIVEIFKAEKPEKLFENKLAIALNEKSLTCQSADFVYYKLNLDYLSKLGIGLEYVSNNLLVSEEKIPEIIYGEFYRDTKHSCIIFVKYYFKHIELHSNNSQTDLKTFVFVNSMCEVYYFDDYSGMQLLNCFHCNLSISHANRIFKKKSFKITPMALGRTYKINTNVNSDSFKEEEFDNIHLICTRLMDILFESYGNANVPPSSEIKIETKFLGMTENTVTVQSLIPVFYSYTGKIEVTEKLEQYEITLYFESLPEKKVRARFALTTAEKNGFIHFTKEHLKDAVLTSPAKSNFQADEFLEECFFIFSENFIDYCDGHEFNEKSVLLDIGKIISEHISIESTCLDCPDLKNTFQKIYVTYFNVHVKDLPEQYSFTQLGLCFEYSKNSLEQIGYYSIKYKGTLYLIKIASTYSTYEYSSPTLIIHLPTFIMRSNSISIFKPVSQEEIDIFVSGKLDKKSTWRVRTYPNYDLFYKNSAAHTTVRQNFANVFPNFAIDSGNQKMTPFYTIYKKYNNEILQNILESIRNLGTATSRFYFTPPFPFGDDDDTEIVKYPIYSGNIIYGYNIQDISEIKCINCSFKNPKSGYSTGNDLLHLEFQSQFPCFKTDLHTLLNKFRKSSSRNEVRSIEYRIEDSELWKLCVKFLIENQSEIFSEEQI